VSDRALARLFALHAAVTIALCGLVHHAASLRSVDGAHVFSGWLKGEMTARSVGAELPLVDGVHVVDEHVVAESAVLTSIPAVFALSLVSGRDGVAASIGGATAFVTPDEILSHQGYDRGISIPELSLSVGADIELVEALLADRLGVTVPDLLAKASFRRIRTARVAGAPTQLRGATTPADVTPALLRDAAAEEARYLARGVNVGGQFRYMVDAPTNRTLPGYDWPRHAGAAYFLAQATEVAPEPAVREAALRAARFLRHAIVPCGSAKCIGSDSTVDVGSTALAILAMVEFARTGLDTSYGGDVAALSAFLRAQQRPDGEFMHFYDRDAGRPIDVQVIYYTGEVVLALARAHALTGDLADLEAAKRGLAYLVGPGWHFFGSRYYFGEEHWTCQAMDDLWDRAPNPDALDFCARWRAYDAGMMHGPDETPYDGDGSFGVGPMITPRLTPVASRTEASVATLDAMARAHFDPRARAALAAQVRRSFALLIREQLRPGLSYLFADPQAVSGALPGSEVDWQLRIDYVQHSGSAMLRAAAISLD
jgi:hypothetical protein